MKLNLKHTYLVVLIALGISSCKQNELLLFEQETAVYVNLSTDSTVYTFATTAESVVEDTVFIKYRIIGKPSPIDRTIKLATLAGATAKEGYHYSLGQTVIKANEFETDVPVYLYRKAGLKDSTVAVVFEIKENEFFKPGYFDQLTHKITITDILKKPTRWESTWVPYFGAYSEVKFRFLLDVTQKTDWESSPFPQDSRYLSQRAKNALLEYNQEKGALIDEFGMEVTFP
ncbi:DUF4843 domain-containing protein [Pedobacter sp.]|uniref:DUF4843 domain-containing protein n=1 Tax=Pedobacter sp. TaxID=1411316 RepID=UPI003D7F4667